MVFEMLNSSANRVHGYLNTPPCRGRGKTCSGMVCLHLHVESGLHSTPQRTDFWASVCEVVCLGTGNSDRSFAQTPFLDGAVPSWIRTFFSFRNGWARTVYRCRQCGLAQWVSMTAEKMKELNRQTRANSNEKLREIQKHDQQVRKKGWPALDDGKTRLDSQI